MTGLALVGMNYKKNVVDKMYTKLSVILHTYNETEHDFSFYRQ